MDSKVLTQDLASYRGPAYIMWRSWRIEGEASFGTTAFAKPEEGAVRLVGTFVVDSDSEPILLTSLAGALHESYCLRLGEEEEHRSPIAIEITGHEGNRITFTLRG